MLGLRQDLPGAWETLPGAFIYCGRRLPHCLLLL
jgi:hypothetical protein